MTSLVQILALPALLATAAPQPRVVTLEEAIESTRKNNITWQSLHEFLVQADAGKGIGWGMFLPKLTAEGQWLHMGERHTPDFSSFADTGVMLGQLAAFAYSVDPTEAAAAGVPTLADLAAGAGDSGNAFNDFIPKKDTFSATFSVVVPIINPTALPFLRGAYDQYDAAVQRVGYGREKLLYGVAQAYYGLVTMQRMIEVAEQSIEAAREHYKTNQVKASLQSVTQLQVKRSELEVASAERQKAELTAALEKAKASFRYLTGIEGPFAVVEPKLSLTAAEQPLGHWEETADNQRKDLAATRIEVSVASHEVGKVVAQYIPSVNFVAQGTMDNAPEQRFDDDPYSWNLLATLSWNLWDGGIRESQLQIARSKYRQAELTKQDLERQIKSEVSQSYQSLLDATVARQLADRQLEVARDTQSLSKASEEAGVATNLEVIDANTMVFSSEAQLLSARLTEAMATLDLLAASGLPPPFAPEEQKPGE